ncbi:MAG: hypothetical protein Q9170_005883 [Blastenia crenularia]
MKFTIATVALFLTTAVLAIPPFDPAGTKNVGNGAAGQFIGGQCLSNADCGSGCCANPTGICSGPGASTQNGKTGCGFGGGAPVAADTTTTNKAAPAANNANAAAAPANGGPPFDPNGAKNLSKEDEDAVGSDDLEVRREDQDKINKFSRLHQRETLLEEELKSRAVRQSHSTLVGPPLIALQKEKEDLEEVSNELELADEDEKVPYERIRGGVCV